MKTLSLYCGAGGIDEGLRQAGIKTDLAIDFNSDACKTLKLNHPDTEVICGKVEDYKNSLSDYDIIVGGPPCQPFSRAKLERSLDPTNINVFWDIVDRLRPKYHLMENVPDVDSVCNRKNYLINCADYGTPQNRVRRFFTNLPLAKVTHADYENYDLFGNIRKKWVSVKEAIGFDGIVEDRKTTFGDGFRPRESSRACFTIVTDCRVWLIKDKIERKATLEECAVLQGFPKDYKFYGNKTSIKRQIGNAVPTQPIKAFFSQIILSPYNPLQMSAEKGEQ